VNGDISRSANSGVNMNRRELLELFGATSVFSTLAATVQSREARVRLDHLLVGASDLDAGIAWVEQKTGVRPVFGGVHPGRGTRNALLSFGDRQYLEVIAPDPAQQTFDFHIDFRTLRTPRVITWAAATTDIDATRAAALKAGLRVEGPHDGSRRRPDGRLLRWKTMAVDVDTQHDTVDPIPFFIQWASDSPHPSENAPPGCRLESLRIIDPNPQRLHQILGAFRSTIAIDKGITTEVIASIATPKGRVELR
jgi:hypothetical protein